MPASFICDGLIPARIVEGPLLERFGRVHDPVAKATVRYSRLWNVIQKNPDLAVRVGGRLYVHDTPAALDALAQALGLQAAPSKPSRSRRVASLNEAVAA